MTTKDIEALRRYRREWYHRNKEHARAKIRQRQKKLRLWYSNYKSTLKCIYCGEQGPVCIDLHHRDPATKDIEPANMVSNGWSIKRMQKEVAKCDPVCANCHRKLHAGLI